MKQIVITLALSLSLSPGVVAQEQAVQPTSKESAEAWLKARDTEFQEYRFQRDEARPVVLKLEPHPVLNWSNPERSTGMGAVYLWTHNGLPQMSASAYEQDQVLKHEFQSLSESQITAERGTSEVHRFRPGLEWKVLPKAPAPAEKRSLRLAQLRRQAERFEVSFGDKEWSETRLLPQPVYRSPATTPEDVSLFVFVQATDPECALLISTDATAPKEWRYALARQTKWGLKVKLDDVEIWDCTPTWRSPPDPQSPLVVIPQK